MLEEQIEKLVQQYEGLVESKRSEFGITLSGPIAFSTSLVNMDEILDVFDIEMFIPYQFPDAHPVVWEVGNRISEKYSHVNIDGTLCLAVPLDIIEILDDDPSLLCFFDKLLVPYLYSYCYWEKHKQMPFGERSHGARGFLEYYLDVFGSKDVCGVLSGVVGLLLKGYKPHEKCACGSGKKALRCHPFESKKIARSPFKNRMIREMEIILDSFKK